MVMRLDVEFTAYSSVSIYVGPGRRARHHAHRVGIPDDERRSQDRAQRYRVPEIGEHIEHGPVNPGVLAD